MRCMRISHGRITQTSGTERQKHASANESRCNVRRTEAFRTALKRSWTIANIALYGELRMHHRGFVGFGLVRGPHI